MSDGTPEKPKKPRKKVSAPAEAGTAAGQETVRSDDELRQAVLNAALPHAAFASAMHCER